MKLLIGMMIVLILSITISGCERGTTEKGKDCWGLLGMDTTTGEYCEPPTLSDGDGRACCAALMPSCNACQEGLTVRQWLDKTCGSDSDSAEYSHWDTEKNEPVWLCRMVIYD